MMPMMIQRKDLKNFFYIKYSVFKFQFSVPFNVFLHVYFEFMASIGLIFIIALIDGISPARVPSAMKVARIISASGEAHLEMRYRHRIRRQVVDFMHYSQYGGCHTETRKSGYYSQCCSFTQ